MATLARTFDDKPGSRRALPAERPSRRHALDEEIPAETAVVVNPAVPLVLDRLGQNRAIPVLRPLVKERRVRRIDDAGRLAVAAVHAQRTGTGIYDLQRRRVVLRRGAGVLLPRREVDRIRH